MDTERIVTCIGGHVNQQLEQIELMKKLTRTDRSRVGYSFFFSTYGQQVKEFPYTEEKNDKPRQKKEIKDCVVVSWYFRGPEEGGDERWRKAIKLPNVFLFLFLQLDRNRPTTKSQRGKEKYIYIKMRNNTLQSSDFVYRKSFVQLLTCFTCD